MVVENLIDKLETIVSEEKSGWPEKAKYRADNRDWLKKSQAIAIKVNGLIRDKGISQKELAQLLKVSPQQVSKILKGQENLTLETISKLENALETTLIAIAKNTHSVG
ncbi:helix-turn-helix transcriptional regulator [Pedobacter hiemivivus]|uniref:Helix-turn-helix transcriptional regulator n=1 Tax=Pedobacter hiemivivus TaxID=2530454 RepID=A0A4U1G618_9SPHI|nr:helix-turn-helix transcriptional regulator [Pedobacter hiemivivus]TKC59211.1 helix-turn-helix transcriptional regulator [Pedobacter hiemivivus]